MKIKILLTVCLAQFIFASQVMAGESFIDNLNKMMPKKAKLSIEEKKKLSSEIYLKYDEKRDCYVGHMGICYDIDSCQLGKDGTKGYFAMIQRTTSEGKGEDRVIMFIKNNSEFVKQIDLPAKGFGMGPDVTNDFRDLRIGSQQDGTFFQWDGSKYVPVQK